MIERKMLQSLKTFILLEGTDGHDNHLNDSRIIDCVVKNVLNFEESEVHDLAGCNQQRC